MAKRKTGIDPDDLIPKMRKAARRGLLEASAELVRKTSILLSQPGHGRWYKRRKGMGEHRASAPGEPPAVESGTLRRDVKFVDRSTGNTIQTRVGTGVKYAPYLEFGKRHMAPRPFMRPALGLARRRMRKLMVRALREGMKK